MSCDYSDPCAEATCEVAAEECISSTCGGCYHYFLDRNENRLSGMKCKFSPHVCLSLSACPVRLELYRRLLSVLVLPITHREPG